MLKSLAKFIQIMSVIMIPLSTLQYYFKWFSFMEPITNIGITIFSGIIPTTINGMDCALLLLILPWILHVLLSGVIFNTMEKANEKAMELLDEHRTRKVSVILEKRKQEEQQELLKKTQVYLLVSLKFIKFTITTLSEREISARKLEIEKQLFTPIEQLRGRLVEHENFDEDDTFAFMFNSQEDALNYIFKFKESVALLDNDVQGFGYSLNYRIILDAQLPGERLMPILEFLEAAVRTVEVNEICTTNSFADKYKIDGAIKNISFFSKGVYSINKTKVELNALRY